MRNSRKLQLLNLCLLISLNQVLLNPILKVSVLMHMETINFPIPTLILGEEASSEAVVAVEAGLEAVVTVLMEILVVDPIFSVKYALRLDMMQVTATFASLLLNLIITVQGGYGYGGSSSYGAPSNVWMQNMARAQSPGQFRPPSQAGSQKGYPAQAFLTGSEAHNSFSNVWYPDSGATHHVTPDASNLMDSMSLSGSDQVHIGNGQGLAITSVGSLQFPSPLHPKTTLKLSNLLLVPSITKNLVSVSQFAKDNDVYFEFHPNHCFVKSQDSSKVLLRGVLGHDGLYQFEDTKSVKVPAPVYQNSRVCNQVSAQCLPSAFTPLQLKNSLNSSNFQCNNVEHLSGSSTRSSVQSFPSMYSLWHSRLGHPHHEVLQSIIKLCNVKYTLIMRCSKASSNSVMSNYRIKISQIFVLLAVTVKFIGFHLMHLK